MELYLWGFSVLTGVILSVYGQSNSDTPSTADALDQLRGRAVYTLSELRKLLASAQPGSAYPTLSSIPETSFSCDQVQQSGFYADPETQCQVYRRCDPSLPMSSYLCPNGTLFNAIALTCDFWYNVECTKSSQFNNFSNPRIYAGPNVKLLYDNNNTTQNLTENGTTDVTNNDGHH